MAENHPVLFAGLGFYYFSDICLHRGTPRSGPVQNTQHKGAVKNRGNGWEVLISRLLGSAGPDTGRETGHHVVPLTMGIHEAQVNGTRSTHEAFAFSESNNPAAGPLAAKEKVEPRRKDLLWEHISPCKTLPCIHAWCWHTCIHTAWSTSCSYLHSNYLQERNNTLQ